MQAVRLEPEFQCFPTWVTKEESNENTDPHELPISKELAADLLAWADRWDATYASPYPPAAEFKDATEEASFVSAGRALAVRLVRELGSEWRVSYAVPEALAETVVSE